MKRFLLGIVALCSVGVTVLAGDWPAWRGPDRDDISKESGLLKKWPADGPEKVWTSTDAGLGYSGIAVVGDTIYTLGAKDGQEFLIALSAEDGSQKWQSPIGEMLENGWGGGPRGTPSVAGDKVVCISGKGNVVCASTRDGSVQWTVNLVDLGGSIPNWGYTESALVDGDRVLCTPGGPAGTMVCLNLNTGKKIWQSSEITSVAHYSSIIAVDHFGKRQYIQLTVDKVFGVDTEGKLQWQAEWPGRTAVIPTPIYRDGQVYVTSGYGVGCMLLNIGPNNQVEKIYENKEMKNHHGGVVLVGDHIYGHSDSVGIICQDFATGATVWSDDRKQKSKGAVIFADGNLYCLEEGSGDCILAKASPDGWQEVSRFTLQPQTQQRAERGRIWTHPVISNGRLYLRDQEIICCYRIR
ncbi:MAG: PQQ-binding-like beta-propeller repeat protein [Planctomycetaceae bacterium]|nr:PQQ-binding-like beta-propeller repeat protein [Planctomycetaceae bacterium]